MPTMIKILILASNPRKDLNLDEEFKRLRIALDRSRDRDQFEIVLEPGVLVNDLQWLLTKHKPEIVHFCGHGSGEEGLIFKMDGGGEQRVRADALANLFGLAPIRPHIKCVILNACYSEKQAKAIVSQIPYVVGMSHTIQDKAAIAFSKGFYLALGQGCSIDDAFEFGRNAIQLEISGSSKARLTPTEEGVRKAEVIETIQQTAILEEHQKPILERNPTLVQSNQSVSDSEQTLSQAKREEIQLDVAEALEEEEDRLKRYRKKVRECLVDHELTEHARELLEDTKEELGLSDEEANTILKEEWESIEKARQTYAERLKRRLRDYPFNNEVKDQLKEIQTKLKLTEKEVEKISRPILDKAKQEHQEQLIRERKASLREEIWRSHKDSGRTDLGSSENTERVHLEQFGRDLGLSETDIQRVFDELKRSPTSIVLISTINPESQESLGTGFIIHQEDNDTYILTCARVVSDVGGANELRVDRNIEACLVSHSNEIGLTVLKIRRGALKLNARPLLLCASGQKGRPFVTRGLVRNPSGEIILTENKGKLIRSQRRIILQISEWQLEFSNGDGLHSSHIGSPVIDKETGYVLGIINHVTSLDGKNSAISIKALREVWHSMPQSLIKPSWIPSGNPYKGHVGRVTAVAFHPSDNQNQILLSSGNDGQTNGRTPIPVSHVKMWKHNNFQSPHQFIGHNSEVRAFAITPDGNTLVTGSKDGTIRIWDVGTGEEKGRRRRAHSTPINTVAFCSEDAFISGSDFRTDGTLNKVVKVWQVGDLVSNSDASKPIYVVPEGVIQRDVRSLAISDGRKFFICGSNDGLIRIISLEDTEQSNRLKVRHSFEHSEHRDKVYSLALSKDGKILVSGNAVIAGESTINIWRVDTDSLTIKLDIPLPGHGLEVRSVAISPDGQTLASGGSDGYVRIWDLQNLKLLFTSRGMNTDIRSVAFSPDGQLLASGSTDSYINIWKVSRD